MEKGQKKTYGQLLQEGWQDTNNMYAGCNILKRGIDRILWNPKTEIVEDTYRFPEKPVPPVPSQ